jgi:hypothetical protein
LDVRSGGIGAAELLSPGTPPHRRADPDIPHSFCAGKIIRKKALRFSADYDILTQVL